MVDKTINDLPNAAPLVATDRFEIQDAAGGPGSSGRVTAADIATLLAGLGLYINQLTGDVTAGPGGGSQAATIANDAVTTAKILNAAVTYAKIQDVSAASRVLGRGSAAGAGDVQELTIGTGLALAGTVLGTSFVPTAIWHPGYRSQQWYTNFIRIAAAATTVSHTLNTIHYTPWSIATQVTIDRVGVRTGGTNAVAGNANVGVYTAVNGAPGAKIMDIATAVAIPGTAGTSVVITPGAGNFDLDAGAYYFAVQTDATINFAGQSTQSFDGWVSGTPNTLGWSQATDFTVGFTEAIAYASGLPANASGTRASTALTSGLMRAL